MGCTASGPADPARRHSSGPAVKPPAVTFAEEKMTSAGNRMTLWSSKPSLSRPSSADGRGRVGQMVVRPHPVRVLLWFSRSDSRSKILCRACTRLQLNYDAVYSHEKALDVYNTASPQLVIIDQRNSKHVPGAPALQLRTCNPNCYAVMVALVSKSFIAKDGAATSILQKGFNRWLVESTNELQCMNELQLLAKSDVELQSRLHATDALFVALNESRDIVEITDHEYNVLYVNRTCVDALGLSRDEMVGHNLLKVHQLEVTRPEQAEQIVTQLAKGREYDGHFMCRRRNGDNLLLPCRAFPVSANSRSVDHHVFVKECPAFVLDRPPPISRIRTRASVRSLRKPSFDLRTTSNGSHVVVRRASLAKAPTGIEAPITKVIGIILSAQQAAPMYVAQALEKGLEILKSTELYSPQLNVPGRDSVVAKLQDPVTNDLLGALLSHGPSPSSESTVARRLSDGAGRMHRHSRPSLPNIQTNSTAICSLLERDMNWNFDIFQLERITNKRPLIWMGMDVFLKFDVPSTLGVDIGTVENWLNLIEANYHSQNSYHNSTHACDVLQCTAYFLERERLKSVFDPVDEAICLIASAVHDVDHPGKNSPFLCNSRNELAMLYNDLSVLESHHAAFAYKLTHSDERVNIFKNLDEALYKRTRQSIIDMVLATEMNKHYEHLSKFVNVFSAPSVAEDESTELDMTRLCTPDNIVLIKRMLIKCADVSNPLRPRDMCVEWANRIAEEYFSQTDLEKEKNLPVVMPIFDRATCSIPKSQKGFVEFFINSMFEAWDSLIDIPELIDLLEENYQYWCDLELAESRGEPLPPGDIAEEESGADSSPAEEDPAPVPRLELPAGADSRP
ncbi:high affinity cAMP-specific and IBMX-insensitive 3',5'-cyclic phosphodiesterase 8B-like isoform X2 [Pollicipes pollicipes]|uniref:high affinity cAMP-specific and IBMX-insensitive 3',5'-cyclic phosphodiesterase 8B-like isoform X2 n=1 Tax=Pollicipes pollicipes TaxID=41117 RepID=UPI001884D891|nr:high affinity cAMP-specific and IBMX-insensitive 3',5'-cyclic phosphodiesterase 8B-like isoform X2 [Pollicipes pollicipes]